ncbi:glutathione S-transferase family protein [Aquicoccus porphyridii]|uniref:Glutathione S-transferase family protein n=1 Tax=Aquicoccus porphyridii TaxID=1852029 RepID=A0A5A9ZH21_9RHOB|nr:glutathione S-transferase family protein [Aquicoccus porphyridii]KAA0916266.1 glutathione S-transferase family protein [Aquicoccus porphyridii]RAI53606.1 glutathione S-transferase [Rhodobacteraceae bacterium AsT-22]
MPVLYHAPESRSETIATLVRMLDADIDIREVTIPRQDGSGGPDPDNPHPEKKVPYLVDGDETLRERGAIIVYLTDAYPAAKLGPLPGEAGRGAYLSWLFYYQGVMEPLIILQWAQLSHPALTATLRDVDTMMAHLVEALDPGPYLLGDRFTAADMLCSSPFHWFPDLTPETPAIRNWVARCAERMQL